MKKTEVARLRLTKEEKEKLRQAAIKHGMTMTKYIRRAVLCWDATDPEETEGLGDK